MEQYSRNMNIIQKLWFINQYLLVKFWYLVQVLLVDSIYIEKNQSNINDIYLERRYF